jgi:hypothetical protein
MNVSGMFPVEKELGCRCIGYCAGLEVVKYNLCTKEPAVGMRAVLSTLFVLHVFWPHAARSLLWT